MPRPASPLGEAVPVGAFWLRLRWGWERKQWGYRRCRCEGDGLGTRSVAVQGATESMAGLAVAIVEAGYLIVRAVSVAHAMVVMGVVADMESRRFLFVNQHLKMVDKEIQLLISLSFQLLEFLCH